MKGLVKQNIEFTLKKDRFLHCLKPKRPFGSQVKKSANYRTAVVRWSRSEWLFRAQCDNYFKTHECPHCTLRRIRARVRSSTVFAPL